MLLDDEVFDPDVLLDLITAEVGHRRCSCRARCSPRCWTRSSSAAAWSTGSGGWSSSSGPPSCWSGRPRSWGRSGRTASARPSRAPSPPGCCRRRSVSGVSGCRASAAQEGRSSRWRSSTTTASGLGPGEVGEIAVRSADVDRRVLGVAGQDTRGVLPRRLVPSATTSATWTRTASSTTPTGPATRSPTAGGVVFPHLVEDDACSAMGRWPTAGSWGSARPASSRSWPRSLLKADRAGLGRAGRGDPGRHRRPGRARAAGQGGVRGRAADRARRGQGPAPGLREQLASQEMTDRRGRIPGCPAGGRRPGAAGRGGRAVADRPLLEEHTGPWLGHSPTGGLGGRRIGLWYWNSAAAVEAHLAVEWVGGTRVPVDPGAPAAEARAVFESRRGRGGAGRRRAPAAGRHAAPRRAGAAAAPGGLEPTPVPPDRTALPLPADGRCGRAAGGADLLRQLGSRDPVERFAVPVGRATGPASATTSASSTAQQLPHGTGIIGSLPVPPHGPAPGAAAPLRRRRLRSRPRSGTGPPPPSSSPGWSPGWPSGGAVGPRGPLRRCERLLYGGAPFALDELHRCRGAPRTGRWCSCTGDSRAAGR